MSGRDGSLVPVGMMVAASMQLELGSGGSGTVLHFPGAYPHREKYDVFVSRSSNTTDKKFWKEISDWLAGLNDDRNKVRIYDHNLIRAGQKIGEEARVALREVDVIILLMSQEYKISSLMQREFPDLLRVREGGALLLTLYVSIFDDYNLEQITGYRRVGAEYDPLEELKPAARRRVYLELVNVIRSRLAESGRYNHLLSYVISEAK